MTTATENRMWRRARLEWGDALRDARQMARIASAYDSALENPYNGERRTRQARLEDAALAFAPLLRMAIEAGHHGRWIQSRLPRDWRLWKSEHDEYGAVVNGNLGVCLENQCISSGVSDRDMYVQWAA